MATRGMHFIWLYADSLQEYNCSAWRCEIPSSGLNAEVAAVTCASFRSWPSALRAFLESLRFGARKEIKK